MSRIRTVKPDFFKDDELAELGPYAMLLFEGLWCLADRDGRLEDRPRRIKAEILPYFPVDVEDILQKLSDAGFIRRYMVDGHGYIWVIKFKEHQRITGKEAESPSKLPPPPPDDAPTIPTHPTPDDGESKGKQPGNIGETTETTGKEGKGKNTEPKGSGASAPAENEGNQPFSRAMRVLSRVYAALGWAEPKHSDVRVHLKEESPIQILISEFGEETAGDLFLFAHRTWSTPPTWKSVGAQRNQLYEQLKAERAGLKVVSGGAKTADQLREVS
jgi:hypothetical protein